MVIGARTEVDVPDDVDELMAHIRRSAKRSERDRIEEAAAQVTTNDGE